jgi:hypothetical protein
MTDRQFDRLAAALNQIDSMLTAVEDEASARSAASCLGLDRFEPDHSGAGVIKATKKKAAVRMRRCRNDFAVTTEVFNA